MYLPRLFQKEPVSGIFRIDRREAGITAGYLSC
jgi:hypothetical protein